MIGFYFIVLIHYFFKSPGPDTPIKISALISESYNDPFSTHLFVNLEISYFAKFMFFFLPSKIAPNRSQTIILLNPKLKSNLTMVIPAAPAPFTTILHYFISFSATFKELITAERHIIAVPC